MISTIDNIVKFCQNGPNKVWVSFNITIYILIESCPYDNVKTKRIRDNLPDEIAKFIFQSHQNKRQWEYRQNGSKNDANVFLLKEEGRAMSDVVKIFEARIIF